MEYYQHMPATDRISRNNSISSPLTQDEDRPVPPMGVKFMDVNALTTNRWLMTTNDFSYKDKLLHYRLLSEPPSEVLQSPTATSFYMRE